MLNFQIRIATDADRLPVYRMLELYQHDLSDIWDQDLDAHGEFGFMLDRFWANPTCKAYVFTVNGKYAGCALVDKSVRFPQDDYWMSQFFVMKKYRSSGVGRKAALHIFTELGGRWEVGQMPGNAAALAFWTKVISECSGGSFESLQMDDERWHGSMQRFEVPRLTA